MTITMKLEDPKASTTGGAYTFQYVCKPPADKAGGGDVVGTLGAIGAGEAATSESIPEGSTCTVTQQDNGFAGGDLVNSGYNSVLVLERNKQTQMQAVRKYDDRRGTLRITNAVAGSGADMPQAKEHKSHVSYACTSNSVTVSEGNLTLKPGEHADIHDVQVGASTPRNRRRNADPFG